MSIKHYARPVGLVILVAATIYGVHQFVTSDWTAAADYWLERASSLPFVILLACLGVTLEAIGWMWVYERLDIRAWNFGGVCAFLAGRAGLILPAQLGRLIRQDSMVQIQRGSVGDTLKAEFVAFYLEGASVVALLAGLAALKVHPLAAPAAGVGTIALLLVLANRAANMLSKTRLELPKNVWWQRQTVAIVFVEMGSWVAHGLALWVMVRGFPGQDVWGPLFFAPISSIAGVGSGVPGGVGTTEVVLGASLRFMEIPSEHMVLVVAAYRLVTFWAWLPIGFIGLVLVRRFVRLNHD